MNSQPEIGGRAPLRSMSRPATATGGALAAARKLSRSATARNSQQNSEFAKPYQEIFLG
jgi:hypothetical protein